MALIYIGIITYNPVPNIKYYREGGILVSFKGERVLIQTKSIIDKIKLKRITMVNKVYKEFFKINIGDDIRIRKESKNYILDIDGKEYMLLVNKEKINGEYDIIDFSTGELQEVIIFDKKVISR